MTAGTIIRAKDLRPGDDFETLHTGAAGIARKRLGADGLGVSVELWYPNRTERFVSLHPHVKVRLLARAQHVA